jgi:hypothetical protein
VKNHALRYCWGSIVLLARHLTPPTPELEPPHHALQPVLDRPMAKRAGRALFVGAGAAGRPAAAGTAAYNGRMISREPMLERLATARSLLLEPFGLDETHLWRALAEIRAHRVDDADLYFQYTRSEGWSLEEGIVKTGSFSIDQGVGVRAVSGEKTAFAYSDDISEASLMDAARTVDRKSVV